MDTKKLKKVNSGFTLVELLVALFVFALLSAFAFRAVNMLSKAGDQLSAEQSGLAELQKAMLIWERDMRQVVLDSVVQPDQADAFQDAADEVTVARFAIKAGQGAAVRTDRLQHISYILKDHTLARVGVPTASAEPDLPEGVPILKHVSSAAVEWLPGLADTTNATGEGKGIAPVGVVLALTHNELGTIRRVSSLISLPPNVAGVMKELDTLGSWQNETTTGAAPQTGVIPKKDPAKEEEPIVRTFSW